MIEPRAMGGHDRCQSTFVGRSSRKRTAIGDCVFSFCSAITRSSATPNMPIAIGTRSIPCESLRKPKVKRLVPDIGSMPMVLSARPAATITNARDSEESVSRERVINPSKHSAKYSGGPNVKATLDSRGPTKAMPTTPMVPATKEPIAATNSAGPARPRRAIS